MNGQISALNSHVLVLNKLWMAIRVIDARRAFSLLFRDLAEVIRVDDGSFTGHDFESWTEISDFARQFQDPNSHKLLSAKMFARFVAKEEPARSKYIEAFEQLTGQDFAWR